MILGGIHEFARHPRTRSFPLFRVHSFARCAHTLQTGYGYVRSACFALSSSRVYGWTPCASQNFNERTPVTTSPGRNSPEFPRSTRLNSTKRKRRGTIRSRSAIPNPNSSPGSAIALSLARLRFPERLPRNRCYTLRSVDCARFSIAYEKWNFRIVSYGLVDARFVVSSFRSRARFLSSNLLAPSRRYEYSRVGNRSEFEEKNDQPRCID